MDIARPSNLRQKRIRRTADPLLSLAVVLLIVDYIFLAPNVYGTSELLPAIDAAWSALGIGASHNILTGCADDLPVTVYTRVSAYAGWIAETMRRQ